jgi:hypothetical protein
MDRLDSGSMQVLIGVVLGGLITAGSTLFFEWYRDRRDSQRLAQAFRGEIKALQAIVEKRQYIEQLRNIIGFISAEGRSLNLVIRVRREYFRVYETNIDKIGLLKNPLPEQIAAFYVRANAILEDLNALDEGLWQDRPPEQQIKFYSELLALFEETMRDGSVIIEVIDEKYS